MFLNIDLSDTLLEDHMMSNYDDAIERCLAELDADEKARRDAHGKSKRPAWWPFGG